ncbi:MAG TPA: hypothetical protein VKI62_05555, partial [Bacteroidota bacterium]|nr:hypothetical protein [Bacteroidota bacterium]
MKNFLAICAAFLLVINSQTTLSQTQSTDSGKISMHEKSVLDFTMTTIDGKPRPLSSYKGKVL